MEELHSYLQKKYEAHRDEFPDIDDELFEECKFKIMTIYHRENLYSQPKKVIRKRLWKIIKDVDPTHACRTIVDLCFPESVGILGDDVWPRQPPQQLIMSQEMKLIGFLHSDDNAFLPPSQLRRRNKGTAELPKTTSGPPGGVIMDAKKAFESETEVKWAAPAYETEIWASANASAEKIRCPTPGTVSSLSDYEEFEDEDEVSSEVVNENQPNSKPTKCQVKILARQELCRDALQDEFPLFEESLYRFICDWICLSSKDIHCPIDMLACKRLTVHGKEPLVCNFQFIVPVINGVENKDRNWIQVKCSDLDCLDKQFLYSDDHVDVKEICHFANDIANITRRPSSPSWSKFLFADLCKELSAMKETMSSRNFLNSLDPIKREKLGIASSPRLFLFIGDDRARSETIINTIHRCLGIVCLHIWQEPSFQEIMSSEVDSSMPCQIQGCSLSILSRPTKLERLSILQSIVDDANLTATGPDQNKLDELIVELSELSVNLNRTDLQRLKHHIETRADFHSYERFLLSDVISLTREAVLTSTVLPSFNGRNLLDLWEEICCTVETSRVSPLREIVDYLFTKMEYSSSSANSADTPITERNRTLIKSIAINTTDILQIKTREEIIPVLFKDLFLSLRGEFSRQFSKLDQTISPIDTFPMQCFKCESDHEKDNDDAYHDRLCKDCSKIQTARVLFDNILSPNMDDAAVTALKEVLADLAETKFREEVLEVEANNGRISVRDVVDTVLYSSLKHGNFGYIQIIDRDTVVPQGFVDLPSVAQIMSSLLTKIKNESRSLVIVDYSFKNFIPPQERKSVHLAMEVWIQRFKEWTCVIEIS
ncbi:hypothetical protein HDU76_002799 [Blyttiomyces sp. JEL0837]|nr:hypothetical protein HDU76_002799 [Blyttiomyces sp. JEL0837]